MPEVMTLTPKEVLSLIRYGKRRGFIAGILFTVITNDLITRYNRGAELNRKKNDHNA